MYRNHFHLTRNPFEVSPDPFFFLPTPQHREAMAGLVYGISERKGFLVLTGEVGTGKSLVVRCMLEALRSRPVCTAYIFNSALTPTQFLRFLAEDLGVIHGPCSKSGLLLSLSRYLIENHRKGLTTVAIVDEAHHLDAEVLEEVRLLTNLETPQGKLLQIALIGQPELDQKLERRELRQLKQRITMRFRLGGLTEEQTRWYVRARLRLAGEQTGKLFTGPALAAVYGYSAGIPRLINTLCDNALLAAYGLDRAEVDAELVEESASDLRLTRLPDTARVSPSARQARAMATTLDHEEEADRYIDNPAPCEVQHEPSI